MTNLYCQYCKRPTELVDSKIVYRKSYGLIYLCKPCQAWVGVHEGTTRPKGEVANAQLRQLRKKAHKYFDFLWKEKLRRKRLTDPLYKKRRARASAYKWLAKELGIEGKDCHIGMFDMQQCQKTISICRPYVEKILILAIQHQITP